MPLFFFYIVVTRLSFLDACIAIEGSCRKPTAVPVSHWNPYLKLLDSIKFHSSVQNRCKEPLVMLWERVADQGMLWNKVPMFFLLNNWHANTHPVSGRWELQRRMHGQTPSPWSVQLLPDHARRSRLTCLPVSGDVPSEGLLKTKQKSSKTSRQHCKKAIKKLRAYISYGLVGLQLAWKENQKLIPRNAGGSVKSL